MLEAEMTELLSWYGPGYDGMSCSVGTVQVMME